MTIELDKVTAATFEPHVGSEFQLDTVAGTRVLTLNAVASQGSARPERREGFSLVFEGAPGEILPQKIYELTHSELGSFSLFIVPIGESETGVQYEAIFN